ncbi:MAG: DAK2 domain-containing protein [Lachnospiraceae bacterium]|nr:DAK2 domain-containing protein [Lachnospiraceae bacterium]
MAFNVIDAKLLRSMFIAGAKNLEAKKEYINELNVFPVPDGDTGTNMTLTIMSAAKEVAALPKDAGLKEISKAISSGSLRGARGNSGVILSQLFRGMCKVLGEVEGDITVDDLIAAFEKAVESAYKAVMKPKEGTILTVAKGAYEKAAEFEGTEDMDQFIDSVIDYAQEVLNKTPDMLPVLKQAGVVDSGGQGLLEVLKGAQKAFRGEELDLTIVEAPVVIKTGIDTSDIDTSDIKFGYCTEFIIMLNKTFNVKHEMDFKSFLESIGDSIVVVADDDIVKVHVHTNDPGLAIQRALTYGALSNMKIDNMRLEHEEKLFKEAEKNADAVPVKVEPEEWKDYGFISVSIGEGINAIFKDLGVDRIIEGGQTMNPSTEDILEAIESLPAKTIYVLPNNKNIVMAANQARDLTEDKEIVVVPTKTIPQGIAAIINFVPELSGEENLAAMTAEIENVKTGQVTYAVRDTEIDNKVIKENDIMGIGDKSILAVGETIFDTTVEMVEEMMKDSDCELISIYYGSDVDEEDAEALQAAIEEKFPDCDVELQYGGQPIYYYVISAE